MASLEDDYMRKASWAVANNFSVWFSDDAWELWNEQPGGFQVVLLSSLLRLEAAVTRSRFLAISQ